MGNSIRRVGLLSTVGVGEDQPFHYQLGRTVSIYLSERSVLETPKKSEGWTMFYTIDVSTCELTLTKEEGGKGLLIKINSVIPDIAGNFSEYDLNMDVTESDARVESSLTIHMNGQLTSSRYDSGKQIHAGGSVTDTTFFLLGTGDVGCFIVLERKKKKEEEERPYAVTLAHYIASSGRINDYSRNKTDVGLSVMVKIRSTNGNLDVTVEGPEQHPAFGLRYLFQEAMRSKIWKPTLCPHCANIQKQLNMMTWQSDSDSSESVPVARRHGGSQKSSRTVNNGGRFNGDGNGNYTEIKKTTFLKLKWW
ncbi:hypothetical protein PHAVU_004G166800 [Phaseolus vulgaris]|uniref:Uncharacterized protein n=1 Tax=Phaseolus vulgaris TaxID=3885 RepID=V7C6E2_PHAVU|nr:hypothetical protein PHAVU_004G166800g [Phaseolus vulgaris]ESW24860.1 hypothetical protein PHAVU_004G166800g [Phaseolus vulgaris]